MCYKCLIAYERSTEEGWEVEGVADDFVERFQPARQLIVVDDIDAEANQP